MESSSEDSSRDSDCTNPDNDSIFRPRRSARLAKKLKYDHDTAPANTTTAGSSTKTVAKAKATAGRKKAAPKKTRKAVVLDILHSFQAPYATPTIIKVKTEAIDAAMCKRGK